MQLSKYELSDAWALNLVLTLYRYPVASLQRAGQLYTPSPPWVAVHRLRIPHPSLKEAADYLVTALGGEDMAYRIAGGTVWWQARAGPGVEAEWITMKRDDREHVNTENVWAKENPDDPEAVDVGCKSKLSVPLLTSQSCPRWTRGGVCFTFTAEREYRGKICHSDSLATTGDLSTPIGTRFGGTPARSRGAASLSTTGVGCGWLHVS